MRNCHRLKSLMLCETRIHNLSQIRSQMLTLKLINSQLPIHFLIMEHFIRKRKSKCMSKLKRMQITRIDIRIRIFFHFKISVKSQNYLKSYYYAPFSQITSPRSSVCPVSLAIKEGLCDRKFLNLRIYTRSRSRTADVKQFECAG